MLEKAHNVSLGLWKLSVQVLFGPANQFADTKVLVSHDDAPVHPALCLPDSIQFDEVGDVVREDRPLMRRGVRKLPVI